VSPAPPGTTPLHQQLEALQRDHPARRLVVRGTEWSYVAVGAGRQGLLLLPGAAGGGEAYLRLVPELQDRHRLLMIRYPAVDGLDAMLAGLEAIVAAEGVRTADAIGGSFGGLVAQAFLRRFPARTGRVVLSGTGPAEPRRAASNERWLPVARAVPMGLVHLALRLAVSRVLRNVQEEPEFWRGFYRRAIDAMTREDLLSRYRVSMDFDRAGPPTPGELAGWPGELLVLHGGRDSVAAGAGGDALAAAYPRATLHTFPDAGHGLLLERPRAWVEAVKGFLDS
jgi:pimeloyl-ACP methyl ester carboxylesterase